MNKIIVLHILWTGRSGGAERFVKDIVAYSDNRRFTHIVCFLSSGGIIADQIKQGGGDVIILGMKSGVDVLVGLRLIGLLSSKKISIVNVHVRSYFIAILLCLFKGSVKCLYFEHGGALIGDNPNKEALFYRTLGSTFEIILANSDYVKERILKVSRRTKQTVKTFYIGIDIATYGLICDANEIKRELRIPLGKKIVGIVGRLVRSKGMDDFIKVAAELQKVRRDVCFVIVGDGEEATNLENLAKSLNVSIMFLGERNDVPRLLKVFDVFLLTSRWESFGIVILEVLAARVPLVGFNVPGASEIISKGGGILVEGRDHIKLVQCAVDLLDSPEVCLKLSNEGYRNVNENFNIRVAMRDLELLYESMLNFKCVFK